MICGSPVLCALRAPSRIGAMMEALLGSSVTRLLCNTTDHVFDVSDERVGGEFAFKRLSAERHAQTGAEIRKADEVWKSINSGFCPKRMEEPDNSTGIRCPKCGRVSYNINDLIYRYCGHCKQFHDLMPFNWTSGRYPHQ